MVDVAVTLQLSCANIIAAAIRLTGNLKRASVLFNLGVESSKVKLLFKCANYTPELPLTLLSVASQPDLHLAQEHTHAHTYSHKLPDIRAVKMHPLSRSLLTAFRSQAAHIARSTPMLAHNGADREPDHAGMVGE